MISAKARASFCRKGNEQGADDAKKAEFLKNLNYFAGNYDDPHSFTNLAKRLDELDAEAQLGGNRLFYLATPPEVYTHVIVQLGAANLAKKKSDRELDAHHHRKPFRLRTRNPRKL